MRVAALFPARRQHLLAPDGALLEETEVSSQQLWGELAYEMWLFPDSRLQLVVRVGLAVGYQHVDVTLPGEDDAMSLGIASAVEINLRSVALDGLGIEHMPATALRANYHLQGFSVEHSAERALHHYLRLYASLYLSLGT